MMKCPPSLDDVTEATLKLLPRGRAWQTDDGLPPRARFPAFNPDAFGPGFAQADVSGSVLWQYWRAFAEVLFYFYMRLCALREEFWCQTVSETTDEWMTEYGLPDACDPFPDLCTKVSAIGGTRCEYYAEVAARAGWSISCEEMITSCGSKMGCRALMGKASYGATVGFAMLKIVVDLGDSPAWQPAARFLPALSGRMRMGRRFSCGPNLSPLQCLLSRVIHAEILTVYEVHT